MIPVFSLTSACNKSLQSLFYKEEVTLVSLILSPQDSLNPSTYHLGKAGSLHASSEQLGLELTKAGWLEAELERVQVFARGLDNCFCELESTAIQTYSGYLETLRLEAKFRAVALNGTTIFGVKMWLLLE